MAIIAVIHRSLVQIRLEGVTLLDFFFNPYFPCYAKIGSCIAKPENAFTFPRIFGEALMWKV